MTGPGSDADKEVVPGRGMDPARAVHIIGEVAKALDYRAERHALPGSSASHPRARRNGQHEEAPRVGPATRIVRRWSPLPSTRTPAGVPKRRN